MDVARQLMRIS